MAEQVGRLWLHARWSCGAWCAPMYGTVITDWPRDYGLPVLRPDTRIAVVTGCL